MGSILLVFSDIRRRRGFCGALDFGEPEFLQVGTWGMSKYPIKIQEKDTYAISSDASDDLEAFVELCPIEFDKILLCRQSSENYASIHSAADVEAHLGIVVTEEQRARLDVVMQVRVPPILTHFIRILQNPAKRVKLDEDEHWKKRLRLAAEEEKEDEELEDDVKCAICWGHPKSVMMDPCQHMCVCATCAVDLMKRDEMECPLCKEVVKRFMVPIK